MPIVLGGILAFLSVAMGAFGAHALSGHLVKIERATAIYQTAVHYQMFHALGLLVIGVWAQYEVGGAVARLLKVACWSLFIATVLFSGSLYVLAITNIRSFALITPIGGVLFLVGWTFIIVAGRKTMRSKS